MANNDIRLYARGAGIPLWKIADALGISEPTMTRRMRVELSPAKKSEIKVAIEKLKGAAE